MKRRGKIATQARLKRSRDARRRPAPAALSSPERQKVGGRIPLHRKAIEGILLALVLLIPLVFATDTGYPKTTLFNLGVIAMALLWLLERVATNRWDLVRSPLYRPIVAMLGVGFISTIIHSYKYAAVSEMLRQIGYVAFFLIVFNTIREGNRFRRLVSVMLIGAVVPCIYGVIQLLHLDWIPWSPEPSWKRLLATFGNPTYFAAYLATLLPLGIALLITPRQHRSSTKGSLALALLMLLMAICLIYTYARAAWLGFLFVLLVQAILAAFWLRGREKLRMLLPAVALCLPVAAAFVLPGTWSLPERLKSSFTADPSNVQRALTWQAAFSIFKSHPILGTGPGTFFIYLPEHQSPEFFRTGAMMASHAHNEFLEVGAETGALGLLAFLWLLVAYYWSGFKGLKEIKDTRWRLTIAGLMGGVGAFLICNQAGVTLRWTSGASFYWLFLALTGCAIEIALREQRKGQEAEIPKGMGAATLPTDEKGPGLLPLRTRRLLYVLSFLMAAYGASWNIRLLASEFRAQDAYRLTEAERYTEARDEYEKAVSLNPYAVDAYYKLGFLYVRLNDPDKGLQAYLRVQSLAPNYVQLHPNLGGLYATVNDPEKAKREFQLSVKLDNLPTNWVQLGMVEAELGQLSEAKEHIYKGLQEDENLAELKPHSALGWAYQKAKKWSEAADEYEKALEFDPKDYKLRVNLGMVYSESGRLPEAMLEYEEAIRLNPEYAYAYANLASAYTKQGKTRMAVEMWRKTKMYASPDSDLAKQAAQMLGEETAARR